MDRIMIIGCGGAGKSTLARKLGEKLSIPVVHLDKLWWKPGWIESERDAFDCALAAELEKPRWIMDGNFSRTLRMRLERCDTVIYLDFPRITCILSVLIRVLSNWGKTRPDMTPGCNERFDFEFLKWIWNYNRKNRENNYRLMSEIDHAQTVVLKNRTMVRRYLNSL